MSTHLFTHTHCSPSPTASPCWAEWWLAWGASGIRLRWTTDYAPRTSHSSGTCRGKHPGKRHSFRHVSLPGKTSVSNHSHAIFYYSKIQRFYVHMHSSYSVVMAMKIPRLLMCNRNRWKHPYHDSISQTLEFNGTRNPLISHYLLRQTCWHYINASSARKQLSANVCAGFS